MNSCEICGVPLADTIPHNVFGYNVCSECKANTPVERFSCPKCNAPSVLAPFYKDVTIECPKCKTEYVAKKDGVLVNTTKSENSEVCTMCDKCSKLLKTEKLNIISARNLMCPECFKRCEWVFNLADLGNPVYADALHKSDAVRYNKDKLRVDLIPTEFIEEVAKVFTFGAKKYSPNNWKGFNESQQKEIIGSLLRHILEYQKGNKFDDESGLHHLAHAACNISFILYFENQGGTK